MFLDFLFYLIIIAPIIGGIVVVWDRAFDTLAGKLVIAISMFLVGVVTMYFLDWSVNDPQAKQYQAGMSALVVATTLLGFVAKWKNRRLYSKQQELWPTAASVLSERDDR